MCAWGVRVRVKYSCKSSYYTEWEGVRGTRDGCWQRDACTRASRNGMEIRWGRRAFVASFVDLNGR